MTEPADRLSRLARIFNSVHSRSADTYRLLSNLETQTKLTTPDSNVLLVFGASDSDLESDQTSTSFLRSDYSYASCLTCSLPQEEAFPLDSLVVFSLSDLPDDSAIRGDEESEFRILVRRIASLRIEDGEEVSGDGGIAILRLPRNTNEFRSFWLKVVVWNVSKEVVKCIAQMMLDPDIWRCCIPNLHVVFGCHATADGFMINTNDQDRGNLSWKELLDSIFEEDGPLSPTSLDRIPSDDSCGRDTDEPTLQIRNEEDSEESQDLFDSIFKEVGIRRDSERNVKGKESVDIQRRRQLSSMFENGKAHASEMWPHFVKLHAICCSVRPFSYSVHGKELVRSDTVPYDSLRTPLEYARNLLRERFADVSAAFVNAVVANDEFILDRRPPKIVAILAGILARDTDVDVGKEVREFVDCENAVLFISIENGDCRMVKVGKTIVLMDVGSYQAAELVMKVVCCLPTDMNLLSEEWKFCCVLSSHDVDHWEGINPLLELLETHQGSNERRLRLLDRLLRKIVIGSSEIEMTVSVDLGDVEPFQQACRTIAQSQSDSEVTIQAMKSLKFLKFNRKNWARFLVEHNDRLVMANGGLKLGFSDRYMTLVNDTADAKDGNDRSLKLAHPELFIIAADRSAKKMIRTLPRGQSVERRKLIHIPHHGSGGKSCFDRRFFQKFQAEIYIWSRNLSAGKFSVMFEAFLQSFPSERPKMFSAHSIDDVKEFYRKEGTKQLEDDLDFAGWYEYVPTGTVKCIPLSQRIISAEEEGGAAAVASRSGSPPASGDYEEEEEEGETS